MSLLFGAIKAWEKNSRERERQSTTDSSIEKEQTRISFDTYNDDVDDDVVLHESLIAKSDLFRSYIVSQKDMYGHEHFSRKSKAIYGGRTLFINK
jgi:hypothetical protein